jgi:glutamyl-tRNA synthetase
MLNFLFVKDFTVAHEEGSKISDDASQKILVTALASIEGLSIWKTQEIEERLRAALIDGMGLKPRVAFSAIRIAITGSHISPPLFESLELLGKERSLERIRAAISK